MSGPVQDADQRCRDEHLDGIETREGRTADVGGLPVHRVLPTKGRRTIGAWCFVDLLGPADAEEPDPMEVGPHPHIGLSTVTWLHEGEAVHTDSLGTEQLIRPGQVNLMTAGHGIAHAELAATPPFYGAQLWIAQPESTRHGDSAFEHHADLPGIDLAAAHGLVFSGTLDDVTAPTRTDTPLTGADLTLRRGITVLPLRKHFEYAVAPTAGRIKVGPEIVEPGWLALIPGGVDELPVEPAADGARMLLLGGEPLGEEVQMWWNFVGRDQAEFDQAYLDWNDRTDRFGAVPSKLARIEAPEPPWWRMQARPRGSTPPQ